MKNVRITFKDHPSLNWEDFENIEDMTFFSVGNEALVKFNNKRCEYIYSMSTIKCIAAREVKE